MVVLLPAVHRLLVLLPPLEDEGVDDPRVADVAVLLKLFADAVPDIRGRNIQCI